MQKSYDVSTPEFKTVSEEIHEKAKEMVYKINSHYETVEKTADLYKSDYVEIYDEVMRILNYNEPYVIRDVVSGPKEEGMLEIPRDAKVLDIGCGTGRMGRLLSADGFKDIQGIDGSPNMLKYADESGVYSKTETVWLGQGVDKFPEHLKEAFDLVISAGIWMISHVPKEGMRDAHAAVKVGGYFVTAMRASYWVNGEACGYKDMMDRLISEGKFAMVNQIKFMRGVEGSIELYKP